ncbi:hypothetical protein ABPG72_012845 [Tetrahymena utriculariae]
MDKEEIRQALKQSQNIENRRILIANSVRCLDCTNMNTSIEHVESPIARNQRNVVNTLIRKGYTDREIYEEFSGIFGRHSIIEVRYIDGYSRENLQKKQIKSAIVCTSTLATPFIGYKLLKKFFFKK